MRAHLALVLATALSAFSTSASAQAPSVAEGPASRAQGAGQGPGQGAGQGQGHGPGNAQAQAQEQAPTATTPTPFATKLARWLDVQVGYISVRYRHLDPSTADPTANQFQVNDGFRARLKFDRPGRYGIVLNATSGSGFVGGWDSTGIGTGDRDLEFFVRHLHVDATPVDGLAVQAGSLPVVRGHFTELTGFDGDGYITGERVGIRAPAQVYFDEMVFTAGYVGDLSTPNFFERSDRFDDVNYYQILLSKRLGPHVAASVDYTDLDDGRTLSSALRIATPALGVVHGFRYEQYVRMNHDPAAGFAVAVDRPLPRKGTVEAGFMHIDGSARALNGDRYGIGTRVFASASLPLTASLSTSTFATYAFTTSYGLPNKVRFDLILTWNILKDLQRGGVVK